MIAPLIVLVLALLPAASAQSVDWTAVRAVRVATVDGRQHLYASTDAPAAAHATPVNVAWFRDILSRSAPAPKGEPFLWKGGVLVLADLADGTHRLAASSYGGYVLVDDARAVWRVDPADLAEWERLVLGRPLPDGATPETIVRAMKHVYAFCSSYQDRGSIVTSMREDGRKIQRRKQFATAFARPDRLLFEFVDQGPFIAGARYVIWSSDGEVRSWWSLADAPKARNLEVALAAAAGVSGGTSITLPNLLIPGLPSPPLLALTDVARLEDARLGEHECLRIAGTGLADRRVTLWIDETTLLLVRIDQDYALNGPHGGQYPTTQITTYEPVLDAHVPREALEFDVP
ncbi:MAG: hypothetical protein H6825_02050 [Planctomycetes bacterium]|nr:hypothetical protein [Planctomycetota bacterium]